MTTGGTGGQSSPVVVEIGLREIYDQMQTLVRGQERIDAKVEAAFSSQQTRIEGLGRDISENRAVLDDHEKRLRAMETRPVVTPKAVWVAVGVIIAMLGVFVSLIAAIVPAFTK